MSGDERAQMQRPGAGLPKLEHFVLNAAFKIGTAFMSPRRAIGLFEREAAELVRIADEDDESYDITRQLRIPRVMGVEESSRNWSVLMILEHLCMVNSDILVGIKALLEGIEPKGTVDTAFYKPSTELDFDTIEQFKAVNAKHVDTMNELIAKHGSLRTPTRHAHPWFGPLDAHQWHCLAAVHQRIHRRQAQKLVAMLGVT